MRIIVTGSRFWTNEEAITDVLDEWYGLTGHLIVVHGACTSLRTGRLIGADKFAHEWVERHKATRQVEEEPHPADWQMGKAGGPIRNKQMVDRGVWCERCQMDGLVAAWPWGESRGTRGCMKLARDAGLDVRNYTEMAMRRLRP